MTSWPSTFPPKAFKTANFRNRDKNAAQTTYAHTHSHTLQIRCQRNMCCDVIYLNSHRYFFFTTAYSAVLFLVLMSLVREFLFLFENQRWKTCQPHFSPSYKMRKHYMARHNFFSLLFSGLLFWYLCSVSSSFFRPYFPFHAMMSLADTYYFMRMIRA